MSNLTDIEQRVALLEQEVSQLKQSQRAADRNGNWLEQLTGSFRDDPEFEEIIRLGREYRRSQSPDSHG